MENKVNPIDKKVKNVSDILTTSKTVLNLINAICIIGILTGIFFSIVALINFDRVINRPENIFSALLLTVGIIVPSYLIILWSSKKRNMLK